MKNPWTTRSTGSSAAMPVSAMNASRAAEYAAASYLKPPGAGLDVAPWPGMSGATHSKPAICISFMSLENVKATSPAPWTKSTLLGFGSPSSGRPTR